MCAELRQALSQLLDRRKGVLCRCRSPQLTSDASPSEEAQRGQSMLKLIGKLGCLQDHWRAIRTDSWCHVVKREILKRGQECELPTLGVFLQKRGEALKPGIGRLCAVDLAHKVEKIFRQVKHQNDSFRTRIWLR